MGEPVNDIMNEKIYLKVAMVFFTLVGLAGGAMSIAGPVVGLTLNPNDLTAVNFRQVERFGLDAALYFDCDKVDTSFGQNMVQQMVDTMNPDGTIVTDDSDARTSTSDIFERLCNDRKASHLYIAITSGVFTIVGMFVFIACGVVKKFEPDFVYIVPMLLSFLMIYDFVETNSNMFAYIKKCTEVVSSEDNKKDKLKNIIVWGNYPNQTMGRYGVTRYGNACAFDDDTVHADDLADRAWLAKFRADNNGADPILPNYAPAGEIVERDHDQEDKACNDLGEGLTVWIIGACFNIIANGMMLSALAIRRNVAQYSDVSDKEMQERVRQERVMAGAA